MGTMSEVVGSRAASFDKCSVVSSSSPTPAGPLTSPIALTPTTPPPTTTTTAAATTTQEAEGRLGEVLPAPSDGGRLGNGSPCELDGLQMGVPVSLETYGPYLRIIPANRQVKELQTIIRDKNTSRSDFKFYADRLIRLVIEEGLNQLPYGECTISTPTGCQYQGLQFLKGNCGVSIVRSGEAMEQGLRLCCRSIRIGKILVESDADTHEARVVYAKFPDDISQRKVLLMYPIMSSGNTVVKSMRVLKEHAVEEQNVILLNLFSTPSAARTITSAFPRMRILTSEVNAVAPNHFGQKYFGTD